MSYISDFFLDFWRRKEAAKESVERVIHLFLCLLPKRSCSRASCTLCSPLKMWSVLRKNLNPDFIRFRNNWSSHTVTSVHQCIRTLNLWHPNPHSNHLLFVWFRHVKSKREKKLIIKRRKKSPNPNTAFYYLFAGDFVSYSAPLGRLRFHFYFRI